MPGLRQFEILVTSRLGPVRDVVPVRAASPTASDRVPWSLRSRVAQALPRAAYGRQTRPNDGSGARRGVRKRSGSAKLRIMLAAYLRVSTPGQDLAMQRDAIARVCKARGEKVDVWFSEKTGGAGAREGLSRLLEQVRSGKVTKVYVWRLDRLSRGGILEVFNYVRDFRQARCGLESVSEGFSLDHPASDLVLAVMASFAEMERAAIRARLAEARVALEAAGGSWGRPRKVDRATVKRIRAMKAGGKSIREISIALKIPRSTVGNYLSGKTPPKRPTKS